MRLLLLLLCAALAGCAEFGAFKELANSVQSLVSGTDNADPPNELKPLEPAVKMTVLWTATVGDGYDGQVVNLVPAVTEERIFAAERNGEVQARGRLKGELLWSVDTDLELSAGPVVAGDRLLLGTSDGELLALNVADGAQLWKTELSSELLALPRVAKDSVVVRTTDGRLSAVDQKTGRLRWSYERSVPPLLVRGLGSPAIAGDLVLDGFGGGKLIALSLADGKTVWEATVAIPHGRSEVERLVEMDADPLVKGDTVYVSGYQGGVAAVSLKDGEVLWRQEHVSTSHGLAADRRSLFLSDANSDLWQLDMGNGADLWKQSDLHMRRLTVPALIKDRLVVGDLEGYVHLLAKEDGSLVGRVRVGSEPIRATPVVFDDIIYVYTGGGILAAIALE
ncbi:outer membrane protein assembly factor BamB [Candidatus Methylocalor cossyra]|uniref:Outer membrane protein assembly factor BamB n=1 Tax=Candidatus Methylocalor cossyra TaxID=3108543 RepID=A0ABM9NH09_9GAMM